MVIQADNRYLREVDEIYTNSRIVANRLKTYNGIDATGILFPPLLSDEIYRPGAFGDYVFYPSRLSAGKRQALAIEAMRYVRTPVKLVIAGRSDSEQYGTELQATIDRYDLQDRVTMLGWISDQEKAKLLSGALGVLYIPYDEDSYGFVTLEGFSSHKPVITMTDSGGTDEMMVDGANGLVVEPDAQRLALALDELWSDRGRAARMGERAYETLQTLNISWDYVLERLTS
jgi:glycosyltransferase involved in cell wall biosynthesis